jgi:hypothetical protein
MPFDRISPSLLRTMRILTGLSLLALSGALVWLSGSHLLDPAHTGALTDWALPAAAVVQGIFLGNAGLMLLELVTRPPFRLAINVPFVASSFQTALTVGLVALAAVLHPAAREAVGGPLLPALSVAALGLNFTFVVMTKLHWNHTANTGKALPKA